MDEWQEEGASIHFCFLPHMNKICGLSVEFGREKMMKKMSNIRGIVWLVLFSLLMIVCEGCGSKTHVRNVNFPPGSDYDTSLYNVNVNMREIGLDRTEIIVSIYEQRRKPYLKREYEYTVDDAEVLRCSINWDTLEDLQILFEVNECISCGSDELAPDTEPFHVLELHFMYDDEVGTFTETPDSDFVPHKWNI